VAVPFGLLIGWLTIRMGNIYVSMVTLSFGLLVEAVVFNRPIFSVFNGDGVTVKPPQFASGDRALAYLAIAVLAIVALIILNVRSSTTGLALGAVRSSPIAAKSIGVGVVQMKVLIAGLAAFVAGIGGGLLALTAGVAVSSNYATLVGEFWLVVLVTYGIRSNGSALLGGLSFTLAAVLALVYLPKIYGNLLPIGFGTGAIVMIKFPAGLFTIQARQFRTVLARFRTGKPELYRIGEAASLLYFVAFAVLITSVSDRWWLWLLITIVVQTVVAGYLITATRRSTWPADASRPPSTDGVFSSAQGTSQ
jgi:branched-chain amino acid transport system permease protein